jgi:hypothetical protein
MKELTSNSVGGMASCIAGAAEQDFIRGASAVEVDVQLLGKSLLWMFFHDGWIHAYPCPLSTSHLLEIFILSILLCFQSTVFPGL